MLGVVETLLLASPLLIRSSCQVLAAETSKLEVNLVGSKRPMWGVFLWVIAMSMFGFVGLVLLGLTWLQPLHFLPWMSWHSEMLAFISALSLFTNTAAVTFKNPSRALTVPATVWPFLVLLLIAVVQVGSGTITYSGDGVVIAFYLGLCIFALVVGHHNTVSLQELALVVLIGATFSVVIELVQVFAVWDSATWISRPTSMRRPGGNLGQPNQLATLLLMGLASLIYLFESKRLGAVFTGFLSVILLLGLAVTESRTGIIGLILMGVSLLIFKPRVALRTTTSLTILYVLGFLGLILAWPSLITAVHEGRWTEAATATLDTSAGLRLVVWPQLLMAVLQRPWFGWGLREVSEAHNAVLHAYPVGEPFTYAHNIVLDLAVGIGIPLTLLFVLPTIFWAVRRVRAVRTLQAWYCVIMLLPFSVHSMLEFPFAYAYFLVPVMLVIGAWEREHAITSTFTVPRWFAATILVISAMVMSWSAWEYLQIEEDFRIVRFEARKIGKIPPDYVRPTITLLTQLNGMLDASRLVPRPHMTAEQVELSRKAAMRFPWTAIQNRYALSLALNGDPTEAHRQIKVMRAMHGEVTHRAIMQSWKDLADTQYPQLREFITP
jgi:O-antigen ligase